MVLLYCFTFSILFVHLILSMSENISRTETLKLKKTSLTEFMTQLINNQRANGYIKSLTVCAFLCLYLGDALSLDVCKDFAGVSASVSASTPVKSIHFRVRCRQRFCQRAAGPSHIPGEREKNT